MDAKLIADRHVIERYLAGQLGDDEADAFEAYLETHPALATEIERVARMKTGFAVLERRGELAALLAEPAAPRSRRPAWMAAAAALVVALGVAYFHQTEQRAGASQLAATLQILARSSESPIPLRASVAIVRARGVGADAEITSSGTAPGAAELELATGGAAGTHFAADLLTVDTGGSRPIARVADVASNPEGVVRLYLSLRGLQPGAYLLRLTAAGAAAPVEYSLRVRPPTSDSGT